MSTPIASSIPVGAVLVDTPARAAQTQPLPTVTSIGAVNSTAPLGSEDLRPITAKPILVSPREIYIAMTGSPLALSEVELLCRRIQYFGIKSWNKDGTCNANDAVVNIGISKRYLPIQVQPWAGYWGYERNALDGQVYDLSKLHALGNAGDFLFLIVE